MVCLDKLLCSTIQKIIIIPINKANTRVTTAFPANGTPTGGNQEKIIAKSIAIAATTDKIINDVIEGKTKTALNEVANKKNPHFKNSSKYIIVNFITSNESKI